MRVAQNLYEAGAITYMRTNGVQMDPSAISAARKAISDRSRGIIFQKNLVITRRRQRMLRKLMKRSAPSSSALTGMAAATRTAL